MIEISNFLYNLVRGLASHLLSDPETRRNLFPPLPPLNNVFFISFFFLVAFLFIVQYFVRQFSHCAINSFCPNCCVVLVTRVIHISCKELYLYNVFCPFKLDPLEILCTLGLFNSGIWDPYSTFTYQQVSISSLEEKINNIQFLPSPFKHTSPILLKFNACNPYHKMTLRSLGQN